MQITSFSPRGDWNRQHARVLRFLFEHGGKCLMREDYLLFARVTEPELREPGTSLLLATVRGEGGPVLAGVSFVAGYGKEAFLIAVHPLYRRKGIGSALLKAQLERLGQLECRAGLDRIPFIGLCFKAGLTAFSLSQAPAGRKLLHFEGKVPNTVRLKAVPSKEGERCCRFPS
ncbi:GNAT family N-acetyltransferase [Paenibacillus sp. VCA1]|uniref:GNAT family N-acetyltransferase n=1 Tax=Paenibacillus sp. VCA1 TaxID=3039148 RepID=UPI002871CAC4|nr:GNAT family N-acetyltransferase [Paenibacillus sp. VCA1]MDR9857989.1 GNAT family N-acetyltransferase [Paenibacillus sp. VCA1]